MELLDPHKNYYLVKTLQGILMMMPIGKAFEALKMRLELMKLDPMFKICSKKPLPELNDREEKEIKEYLTMLGDPYELDNSTRRLS